MSHLLALQVRRRVARNLALALCGCGLAFVVGCAGAARPSLVPVERAVRVDPGPGPAAPPARTADPAPAPVAAAGVHHRVERGQTLWRIASLYGVSVDELVRRNGLSDPDALEEGTLLFVPGATTVLEVPLLGTRAATVDHAGWEWPVSGGRIVSGFGARRSTHRHQGLDIDGSAGQPVLAVQDGRVVYSGSGMRGYGKTVIIDHGNGVTSLYAHNSKLLVQRGQRVQRGQPIGRLGRTGRASAEHCHLEIRRNEVPVDPLLFVTAETSEARR